MLQHHEFNEEPEAEQSCVHDEGLLIHSNDEWTACDLFETEIWLHQCLFHSNPELPLNKIKVKTQYRLVCLQKKRMATDF